MRLLSRKKRPMHLGRYPMEKIRRVDRPTTLITDDVKQVPKRAGFFVRAFYGDLGPKPASEIRRFITKNPLNAAIGPRALDPGSRPQAASRRMPNPRSFPRRSGGNGEAHQGALPFPRCRHGWHLRGARNGPGFQPRHATASRSRPEAQIRHRRWSIDQRWETLEASSGDDWVSRAPRATGPISRARRSRHHRRRLHPAAGLRGAGPFERRRRRAADSADAAGRARRDEPHRRARPQPVRRAAPQDGGRSPPIFRWRSRQSRWISGCRTSAPSACKCARECPAQAIPYGDKVLYNGYETWKPDVEKCTKYRSPNLKGSSCGQMHEDVPVEQGRGCWQHRLAMWAAIKLPFSRRFLIWLDDALGYGKRNPIKRWWLDLVKEDGRVVAASGTNERDLALERDVSGGNERVATYPVDKLPTSEDKETVPLDRKAGARRYEAGGGRAGRAQGGGGADALSSLSLSPTLRARPPPRSRHSFRAPRARSPRPAWTPENRPRRTPVGRAIPLPGSGCS